MKIRWKKTVSFLLAAAMLLSGVADHAQAAAPKEKVSKKKLTMSVREVKKLTMSVGAVKKLTVTNTKGCRVTWKSSRSKVASVTKKGKVVAKRAGNTKITALVKNSKTKSKTVLTCRVTVKGKNKPVNAVVSHSPSAMPPTSSAIAPSISSTPAETEQAPLPTPSDAPSTDAPIEMDRPSGTVTEGAIDFRGRCECIGGCGDGIERGKPQGYAIYDTGDLEKIFGKDGELGKKDGPVFSGWDVQPEPNPDEYYQWMQPVTDPVMAQYDETYFQDKMLYCILFSEGALYYDIHITDVCLAKNEKGKEEITLFTTCDEENLHPMEEGIYMILLELNTGDFERAESIRLGDWYVENHRVSDMGSLEMDRPSGPATEGSIDFCGKCFPYYSYKNDGEAIKIENPQGHIVTDMRELADLKKNVLFPEVLSAGAQEAMKKAVEPVLSRYQEAFFQDKILYCCLFYAGSFEYKFHITDIRLAGDAAGEKKLSVFLDYDKTLVYCTEPGNFVAFLELDRKDYERADEVEVFY